MQTSWTRKQSDATSAYDEVDISRTLSPTRGKLKRNQMNVRR